jgi:hypothetical protein
MEKYDLQIDAALDNYPVSPTPRGFTRRVMAQIRGEQAVKHPAYGAGTRFRLDFLDIALPAFFAGFAGLGFTVLLGMIALLNPLWLLRVQLQIRSFMYNFPWQGVSLTPLPWWVLLFTGSGLAILVVGLLLGTIWLSPIVRRSQIP